MTGIQPPKKSHRLQDADGENVRAQVPQVDVGISTVCMNTMVRWCTGDGYHGGSGVDTSVFTTWRLGHGWIRRYAQSGNGGHTPEPQKFECGD